MLDYLFKFYVSVILMTFLSSTISTGKLCNSVDDAPARCAANTFEKDAINALAWPYYWREKYIVNTARGT